MERKKVPGTVSEPLTAAAQKGGAGIEARKPAKKNPSKENGQKALDALRKICDSMDEDTRNSVSASFIQVEEFLEAAIRKLPSEESFLKDKERRPKTNFGVSSDADQQAE